jgi:DNA-binding MarR family transcriptional regulator
MADVSDGALSAPAGEEIDQTLPALLRTAHHAYGEAVRACLAGTEFDDLPRNGPYVIRAMANGNGSPSSFGRDLGISKQAVSQLIDTLVIRGYIARRIHTLDRRRITLQLTDRGIAAAKPMREGIGMVDEELSKMLTSEQLDGLRTGLLALCQIRERFELRR